MQARLPDALRSGPRSRRSTDAVVSRTEDQTEAAVRVAANAGASRVASRPSPPVRLAPISDVMSDMGCVSRALGVTHETIGAVLRSAVGPVTAAVAHTTWSHLGRVRSEARSRAPTLAARPSAAAGLSRCGGRAFTIGVGPTQPPWAGAGWVGPGRRRPTRRGGVGGAQDEGHACVSGR